MVYTTIGSLFVIIFGMEIGIRTLWMGEGDGWVEPEPLQGHPVRFNLTGHIVPVVCDFFENLFAINNIALEINFCVIINRLR